MTLNDYILNSGGAKGADTEWHLIGRAFGLKNVYHWREPGCQEVDSYILRDYGYKPSIVSLETYEEGQKKATIAARQLGRIERYQEIRNKYVIRDWAQVKHSDAVFAISTIVKKSQIMEHGKAAKIDQVKGGTGYTVQMAINEKKDVYVFDQNKKHWFKYDYDKTSFVESDEPVLTKSFAGIGTREINNEGKRAINSVYLKTYGFVNTLKK